MPCARPAQNPFPFLYRDADVEGMTDGWDDVTAYGWEWASASTSWPAPVATQRHMRLSARNSGLFSLRATQVRVSVPPSETDHTYRFTSQLIKELADEAVSHAKYLPTCTAYPRGELHAVWLCMAHDTVPVVSKPTSRTPS